MAKTTEAEGVNRMKQQYSRKDIENLILGIRSKKYSERQMKYLYAKIRDKIGQQSFNTSQVTQILFHAVSGQLFPQQKLEVVAEKLSSQHLQDFIKYTKQLLGNIENIKKIKLPETEIKDLDFLADAMVGCGLKRYAKATLQKKVREYLRESNQGITQKYDYSKLSGATINGVLLAEYSKINKLSWGLTSFSQELVVRSRNLREAIEILESVEIDSKIVPIMSKQDLPEDEKLRRAIAVIKRDLPTYQSEDKIKLVCLKFILKFGNNGKRKLSMVTHPDINKEKNASLFQIILNSCAEFNSAVEIQEELSRISKAIKSREQRYKRKFHRSRKWLEYVERRKAKGWHSQYYGDAV